MAILPGRVFGVPLAKISKRSSSWNWTFLSAGLQYAAEDWVIIIMTQNKIGRVEETGELRGEIEEEYKNTLYKILKDSKVMEETERNDNMKFAAK